MTRLLLAVLLLAPSLDNSVAHAQTPADRAWEMLQTGAAADHRDTRTRAVEALALLANDERARRLAESKLGDQEPDVRAAAATTLGQVALPASVPALKKVLQDRETEVVFAATGALLLLGDPSAFQVYYAVLTGERKTGEPLLESQMKMLKDPDALARIGLETGAGFIPFGGIGYKMVKTFTRDNVSPVRAVAAQKLAADRDPRSGQALVAAANDEHWLVRASAVSAIAKRGDRSLMPSVVARLDDENETVRFNAAAAIVHLSAAARPKGK